MYIYIYIYVDTYIYMLLCITHISLCYTLYVYIHLKDTKKRWFSYRHTVQGMFLKQKNTRSSSHMCLEIHHGHSRAGFFSVTGFVYLSASQNFTPSIGFVESLFHVLKHVEKGMIIFDMVYSKKHLTN